MDFDYGASFMVEPPDAYETLLLDALRGDATLFTRRDEVEQQWAFVDPIIKGWARGSGRPGAATRPAPGGRPKRTSSSRRTDGSGGRA